VHFTNFKSWMKIKRILISQCDLFWSYVLCKEWPLCAQQVLSVSASRPDSHHQNGNWYPLGSRVGGSDTVDIVETRQVVLTLSPTTIFQLSSTIKCAELRTSFEYFMTFLYVPCSCTFYPEDGHKWPKHVGDHYVMELHSWIRVHFLAFLINFMYLTIGLLSWINRFCTPNRC